MATVVCGFLRSLGHAFTWVMTDTQAHERILAEPPLTALVLDINLGAGTTGFDIARFARQHLPEVKVVYASGEIREEAFRTFGLPGSVLLTKPFSMDELEQALAKTPD